MIKKWRRDIIKFSPVIKINSKGENKLGHTAPFPEDIPEMAVEFFTYKGDVVLDPFAGSGSTLVAAKEKNRQAVGIEMDNKFHVGICERLKGGDNNEDV